MSLITAQRYEIKAGKLENLKGITEYNVTFDYSQIVVNGYKTEAEYLEDKMKKREKVEGKAEKFKEEWYANRKNMYEPAFINYFNKSFKNGEINSFKLREFRLTGQKCFVMIKFVVHFVDNVIFAQGVHYGFSKRDGI